jgi:flagellar biosynthetic protein FliR
MFEISFGVWPQVFFLVLARVAGILNTVPFFWGYHASPAIRVASSLAVALVLTPLAPAPWLAAAAGMNTLFGVFLGMLGEVAFGAAVGLICNVCVATVTVGGSEIAQSAGLQMAEELDPQSGISNTIMTNLLNMIFLLVVVLGNGHLALLRLTAASFFYAGPQLAWLHQGWVTGLISLGSDMFHWGLRIAAPVMAAMLVVNSGFALIARLAQEFDVLFLSIPVRLVVTFVVLGITLRFSQSVLQGIMNRMLEICARVMAGG